MDNLLKNRCFWITGLPGAGKSTLARALAIELQSKTTRLPISLDGDSVRAAMGKQNSHFDRQSRLELANTYGRLCEMFVNQGHDVVCSTVSMFHSVRQWNREHIPGYIEIFLDVSAERLATRDQKQLYSSDNAFLPGVTQEVELPINPDFRFENDGSQDIRDCVDSIVKGIDGITHLSDH